MKRKRRNALIKRQTQTKKSNKTVKSNKIGAGAGSFKKSSCSPLSSATWDDTNQSCLSVEHMTKLKEKWNARHPDNKITATTPREIWQSIKTQYRDLCNNETCWVRNLVAGNSQQEKELLSSFAPKSPKKWKKNPNEWLSSVDIQRVMQQYEQRYKCFEFLGPSPIDFDTRTFNNQCVWEELCNFSLEKQMKRNKTKIGVIFNTDPHDKGGQHWISLFINLKTNTLFFFDSAGDAAPPEIMSFVQRVIQQGTQLSPPRTFTFDQNHPVVHQTGNTECGMYSLFFIIHLLEDKATYHYFKTHKLKDKYIEKYRNIYFTPAD